MKRQRTKNLHTMTTRKDQQTVDEPRQTCRLPVAAPQLSNWHCSLSLAPPVTLQLLQQLLLLLLFSSARCHWVDTPRHSISQSAAALTMSPGSWTLNANYYYQWWRVWMTEVVGETKMTIGVQLPSSRQHHLTLTTSHTTQYDRLLASSCRPTVCLSLCNAMHCGSRGQCTGLKVIPACSYSMQVSICRFRHFCCRMYRSHVGLLNTPEKTSGRKREREFLRHRKLRVHWFIAHYLLLRTWEDRHHELCLSPLRGLSLGAFINSTRENRIAYQLFVGLNLQPKPAWQFASSLWSSWFCSDNSAYWHFYS